ncbi:MAG TPA: vanadium-dependent haloperoxidase [Gemmatimonadales bacterium]|jgi:membrane-associated phospholipid phosphatase|nr:vanadium-dependent haloperoxidase [Gemmatimonadales bacterium]
MSRYTRVLATAAGALLAACSEPSAPVTGSAGATVPEASAVKFWEAGATASWNEMATALADQTPIDASRLYAYLSLAQFRAAEAAGATEPHPPTSAAIAGASAAVLDAFFPGQVTTIEAALDAQEAADPWPGAKHGDFAAGEAMGREIGARVMEFAAGDQVGVADPGTPPAGPGYWQWSGGPMVRGNYLARPFFMESADEFLPPPPPAFGSPAYLTALAEVRQISDTRTAEQVDIASYWNLQQSGRRNAAFNNLAVELIRTYRVPDAKAARIMFLMNGAVFDGLVGCFNAKYTYWFIRPPQADPGITLPIGLPPHPSYPSGHSCVSGSASGVLRAEFPNERERVDAMALEASLSRLYAGIHYRFDMEAGLALGRAVAAKAMAADLSKVAVLP